MAKQTRARRVPVKTGIEARDLLLAGVGAVSLTRKQGIKLYGALLDEGKQLQGRVEQTIEGLQDQARFGAGIVRDRVEAIVTPIRSRAGTVLCTAKSELESRLAPVLDKLGVKRTVKTRVRGGAKRVARKASTATRSAAKKVSRRTKKAA